MDTLKQNKEAIERLTSIYMVANTPYFLYSKFRSDSYVQALSKNSFEEIIKTIQELGGKGIDTIEELSFIYSLYISLTYKEYDKVSKYFDTEGSISFEWFPDIRSIYLSSYIPSSTIELTFDKFEEMPDAHRKEIEVDVITFNDKKGIDNSQNMILETLEIHK